MELAAHNHILAVVLELVSSGYFRNVVGDLVESDQLVKFIEGGFVPLALLLEDQSSLLRGGYLCVVSDADGTGVCEAGVELPVHVLVLAAARTHVVFRVAHHILQTHEADRVAAAHQQDLRVDLLVAERAVVRVRLRSSLVDQQQVFRDVEICSAVFLLTRAYP